MGNLFSNSSQSRSNNPELQRLLSRLQTLESLDNNRDGFVSKDEFRTWQSNQQQDLERLKVEIGREKDVEYQQEIKDLKRQVGQLRAINMKLEDQMKYQDKDEMGYDKKQQVKAEIFSKLSKQKIDAMVERMVENENVNIRGFPDYLERHIYRNVFRMLLGLIGEIVENSNFELLGHQITMNIAAEKE